MLDYLNSLQIYDSASDWVRSNVLIASNAVQLAAVGGIFGLFLASVRPLRGFFVGLTRRFSPGFSLGAIRNVLVPLAETAPWLVLLLAFRFATLVFIERQSGVAVLRLAESLTLAWVIVADALARSRPPPPPQRATPRAKRAANGR